MSGLEPFSTRMRKATRKIHNISDALVNAKFAISLRDENVWGGGLFIFYHVFAYLEDAKERLRNIYLDKLFLHKSLYRKKAFENDLAHYLGANWQEIPKAPALENYLQHLQDLERDSPVLLMAYVYHMYLGLLSGGQILSKKRQMFGDKNAKEVTYKDEVTDFSDVDIPKLKTEFRAAMNEIADHLTEQEKDALIEESKQVFIMNNLIVNSVGGQNQVMYNLLYKASAVIMLISAVVFAYKVHKNL